MSLDLPPEEWSAALDRVVSDLLDAAGVGQPPVDALAIAEHHLGFVVAREAGARRPAGRSKDARSINIDPDSSVEASQWVAAQAIGRHLRPALLRQLGADTGDERPAGGASLANRLAERLLTPTPWFAADAAATGYDLFALKDRYATAGHELIARRWLDLPEPCVVALLTDGCVTWRRSNAFRVNKRLSAAEELCQRAVTASGRPDTRTRAGWTVSGWPVPLTLGDRIFLRSVVEDDGRPEAEAE